MTTIGQLFDLVNEHQTRVRQRLRERSYDDAVLLVELREEARKIGLEDVIDWDAGWGDHEPSDP